MTIRLATLADQEAIAHVHSDSWDATFSTIIPGLVKARGDQLSRRLEQWGKILRDTSTFTYVATQEEAIIGFAQGGIIRKELGLDRYDGELHRLYIAPDKKGQGIGKRLINSVAKTLKEQGKQSLVVVAWSINTPARKIYEHLGARFIKEIVQQADGFDNSQSVYVWQDINTIIERTS